MNQENTFSYKYSAKEAKEIQEIRNKYLPQGESKLDELKRLDQVVQNSGMVESLCIGIGSLLVFGLGMCLAMQVIGSGALIIALGVLLGLIGMAGMTVAFPYTARYTVKPKKSMHREYWNLQKSFPKNCNWHFNKIKTERGKDNEQKRSGISRTKNSYTVHRKGTHSVG